MCGYQHVSKCGLWILLYEEIARYLPSGERLHSNGKSPCLMGKSTISMAIFNSKLLVHQRVAVDMSEENRFSFTLARSGSARAWMWKESPEPRRAKLENSSVGALDYGVWIVFTLPIGSMSGIYANIRGILMEMLPYIAYMDPMGFGISTHD